MAISSRFQPRNLAQQRFNPFYGEMPGIPRGPSIKRVSSPTQGESNTFTFDPNIVLGYGPGQKWTGDRHDFAMVRPPPEQGPDTFLDASGPWVPPDIPIDFTPDDSYLPWWMLDGPGSSAF
jgi:hypothetical protein